MTDATIALFERHSRHPWSIDRLDQADLTDYCQQVFASLPRSDQRNCAQAYVYGLLYGTGRKSTRRIATTAAVGHSDQALQQFVNQSPWSASAVRQRIAELATELVMAPESSADTAPAVAWTLEEVAFPKNGRCSAAVDRQFVPSLGRVANAQLATSLSLTASGVSVPVNWRLCLPPSWNDDHPRRARARIPSQERHRPYWHHLIALVDEVTTEWAMPALPLVTDYSHQRDTTDFLTALHERKLDYLVRVPRHQQVRIPLALRSTIGRSGASSLAELVGSAPRALRETVMWWAPERNQMLRSQFLTLPVQLCDVEGAGSAAGPVRVLVEWPFNALAPTAFWITSMVSSLPALVQFVKQAGPSRLHAQNLGLFDFEGRSFQGWHHHVTLVSAAYAYQLQQLLSDAGSGAQQRAAEA